MENQDWNPIVLRSKKSKGPAKAHVINDTPEKPKILTSESRQAIALTRVQKKWTQKELDQKGPFPSGSCNAWEAGRICPTGPQINILQRVLGIKLLRE